MRGNTRSPPVPRMHTREIHQGSGSQHGIPLPRNRGHQAQTHPRRAARRCTGHGQQNPPVTPVEIMPLAQRISLHPAQSGARVQQAIGHVHRPHRQHQQCGNPHRQPYTAHPRKPARPNHGHGGRIQARQMPKLNNTRRAHLTAHVRRHAVGTRADSTLRCRMGKSQRHHFYCKRKSGKTLITDD